MASSFIRLDLILEKSTAFPAMLKTGELIKEFVYEVPGAVTLDMSRDQEWVAVASILNNKVHLYRRDAETGELEESSVITDEDEPDLINPVSVIISPDSKFVYVAIEGKVAVLAIKEGELSLAQTNEGIEECLLGTRLMSTDPSGKYLFVPGYTAGTVSTFAFNEEGQIEFLNYIMDDSIYAALLAGAHCVTCSPDGKNLYVLSGRFGGDNALTAFRIEEDAKLKMVQEFENEVELEGFEGGNLVSVSPDGKFVFASGAISENFAVFSRNLENGKLEFASYLDAGVDMGTTAGVYSSLDNKFIYAADEGEGKDLRIQAQ